VVNRYKKRANLCSLSSNPASKLNILGHDGYTLSVDSAQVGVLEQTNQVGLSSFLEGSNGSTLESQIGLVVLSNFTNKALEGELPQQEFGTLLVATNFTESNSARSEPLLFSVVQAALAGEVGATLISPFAGRITDFYKQKEGKSGYPPHEDPGVLSVQSIYNYIHKFGYKTVVMGYVDLSFFNFFCAFVW